MAQGSHVERHFAPGGSATPGRLTTGGLIAGGVAAILVAIIAIANVLWQRSTSPAVARLMVQAPPRGRIRGGLATPSTGALDFAEGRYYFQCDRMPRLA